MKTKWITLMLSAVLTAAKAAMELPKFNQMILLYPGYYLHGGKYRDRDIIDLIGGNVRTSTHNTAGLRMSYLLNKFGGRHGVGNEPILLSKKGRDSYTGNDGSEYIFRNTAFGPFLADHYGDPKVAKPNKHDHTKTMDPFVGKQGIVRLVSYHRGRHHAGGHVGLWDCDHFFQSRDFTTETHIISVEFWEAPDSYCPSESHTTMGPPQLATLDPNERIQIISRHNFKLPYWHEEGRQPKLRHRSDSKHAHVGQGQDLQKQGQSSMWTQQ